MVLCRVGAAICPVYMMAVDAGVQSGEAVRPGQRTPPHPHPHPKAGGTEGHPTLDIFLVLFQAFHKKDYFPALGFSEAMKPRGSSLLFI